MPPRPEVLIVGAGPTGLVLALWLTRRGIGVRIIDRTAGPGTTSRALAVQARTLELYRQLGIADGVVAGGVLVQRINLWARGRRAAHVEFGEIGRGESPFPSPLVFPQDAHERLLVDRLHAEGVDVERNTELLRFDQREDRVIASLRRADGTEDACEVAYLAGCDGGHSTVREGLGIGFPGGTYSHRFYVADVEASGPVTDDQLHIDLDDADFLIVFPLRGQGRIRLVGAVRDDRTSDSTALTFADVGRRAMEHLHLDVHTVKWFSTYRVHHRVAARFRSGRVFLLGDAAHVHSPVGGQGMNTGIGDAINLGWKIAAVLRGAASPAILDTFEPERIAFARRLVATTDRAFTFVTRDGPIAAFVRTRIAPRVAAALFSTQALRRVMFRTVSQINVRYPESALSEGRAGSVRGGDRLPWVPLGEGRGNFDPLSSLEWQLHVYGEATDGIRRVCAERGIALHTFPCTDATAHAGLERNAAYLVRPDGYVGLASRAGDAEAALSRYVTAHGVRSARATP